jgi:HK97 family phage portal protein
MDISKLSASELQKLISTYTRGWSVSYTSWSREEIADTYAENPYIFSIVNKIARAAKNIRIMAGKYVDGVFEENENSELIKLIKNPNVLLTQEEFIERGTISYYTFGETFIYFDRFMAGNSAKKVIPGTLQLAPPQIVDIKMQGYLPESFVINFQYSKTISHENMIQLKAFNPDWEDAHGLPFVEVAGKLIDKVEAADETETKTYQNSGPAYLASPSAAGDVEDSTFQSFINKLKTAWKKDSNKRSIAGVNIPINIQPVGQNPADMGVLESQQNAVRMLLVLWGLDPGLFDVEASTYNNKQVMERAIYTEAAIPFVKKMIDKMNAVFEPIYGERLEIDTSDIEVLQPNLKERAEWMTTANVFTENEIREATSYSKRESENADKTPSELMQSSLDGFDTETLNEPII